MSEVWGVRRIGVCPEKASGQATGSPHPDASRASTSAHMRVNVTGPLREIFSSNCGGLATGLKAEFLVDVRDVSVPISMVAIEHLLGEGLAAGDDLAERVEEAALIVAG